ncbi:MAG: T9SS type A sorting domain-containing protein [Bacteroidetes bacterium]|nr:T9SS type A sorting domain-containing protein [Bacteroidota bacterium]
MKAKILSLVFLTSIFFGFIFQVQAQLAVGFTVSDTVHCLGEVIQFTDISSNAISWNWDFGDGSFSTQQNPVHSYSAPGTYQVTLTVSDGTFNQSLSVMVTAESITAQFSANAITTCAPVFVDYQNMSFGFTASGTWDTWWDLGDGTLATPFQITSFNFGHWLTAPGAYSPKMIITSQGGCIDSFTWAPPIIVDPNPLNITAIENNVTCDSLNSGSIDLTVTGGALPLTFFWVAVDSGITYITEDLSGIPAGNYYVSVEDANGCMAADTFTVGDFFTVELLSDTLDCDSATGSLWVAVQGATPPLQYVWSTGDSTVSISNQFPGGYSVTVYDSSGCSVHKAGFLEYDLSCQIQISGQAFIDYNMNCIKDPGDHGVQAFFSLTENQTMGQTQFVSDTAGMGSFITFPGDYTLSVDTVFSPFSLVCPSSGAHNLGFLNQDSSNLVFAFAPPTQLNLAVDLVVSTIRPGFPHTYYLKVTNKGMATSAANLTFVHDPNMVVMPTLGNYTPVNSTLTYNLPPILPGQTWMTSFIGAAPASTMLGDSVFTSISVSLPGDIDTTDNEMTYLNIVVGSFDPNDKQVIPAGEESEGYILTNEQLMRYTVRFQNTGTDTAFYVTIKDFIDEDLALETLTLGPSSHPYSLRIKDRELEFFFDNILLPDSGTNLEASQGFVSYSIRHKETLPIGTQITNKAAIYFDFNAPVITNTVLNTVTENVSIASGWESAITIYPNPASDWIQIKIPQGVIKNWQLFDLSGRMISQGRDFSTSELQIPVSEISSGVYLLEVESHNQRYVGKILIED